MTERPKLGAETGKPTLVWYALFALLFIQVQYPFTSSPRYALAVFPLFIVLARTRVAGGPFGPVLATALLAVQLGYLLRFMEWRWVA